MIAKSWPGCLFSILFIELYRDQDNYLIKRLQENKSGSIQGFLMGQSHSGHQSLSKVHVNDTQVVQKCENWGRNEWKRLKSD